MGRKAPQLAVGSEAPDFTLLDHRGSEWTLSKNRGKVVLLLFYPGNETLVCTKQLCSLRDNWSKYLDTKAEIIAVSVSEQDRNGEFAAKHRLPLPILADTDRSVTAAYTSHWLFPLNFMRGLCVIDAGGMVRTRQTMLRAFRPDDHDVIVRIYQARSDAMSDLQGGLRERIKKVVID